MKKLKRALALALTLVLLFGVVSAAAAESATATTLRLAGAEGSVSVTNASGKDQSVKTDMRLYSGYSVATGKSSAAYISLDGSKAVKLDSSSKGSVKKSGNKLEVCLDDGKLFFNVTAPLASNESLNIRTSTMVTGIRGSFGWVAPLEVVLVHGRATVTCINPVTGETRTTELYSGEKVYYDPVSTVSGDPKLKEIDFIKEIITNDDFPAFVVDEMRKDVSLQTPVIEDVPSVDVPKLLEDYEDIKAAEDKKTAEKEEELKKALDEQTKFIEQDPVDYLFDDEEEVVLNILQYNGNGADGGAVASQTSDGEALLVSANGFTRTEAYYTFSGWNTAADGSGTDYAPGDSITPSGTVTLYAQWEAHIDDYADLVTLLASNDSDIYIDADITYTGAAGTLPVSGNKTLHIPAGVDVTTTDEITYVDGGSLTVTGGGSMTAAGITISCTLTVEDNCIVSINNDLVLEDADSRLIIRDGGTIMVDGTLVLSDGDSAVTVESGGSLTSASMNSEGAIRVLAGGQFELTGDSYNYGTIDNAGTATFFETLTNHGVLTNSGSMTVEGLDNGDQVTNTGSFQCTGECSGEGSFDLLPDDDSVLEYVMNDGKVKATISGDTVTVEGTGPMNSRIRIPYLYNVTKAEVCEGVTSVNFDLFEGLTTVSFPSTVTALEEGAFYMCSSLTQIELPEAITVIPANAFGDSGLTSIVLPAGVKSLGYRAFWDCSDLKDIALPDGLESIEYGAFSVCTSLAALTIPGSVTEIDSSAFSDCGALKSISLPDGITKIDIDTFKGCFSLETVYIPAGVTKIGYNAFYLCDALRELTLPDGVTEIGYCAFNSCKSMTRITIPASVTKMEYSVFGGCTALETINFGGTLESWRSLSARANVPAGVTVVCSDGTLVTE